MPGFIFFAFLSGEKNKRIHLFQYSPGFSASSGLRSRIFGDKGKSKRKYSLMDRFQGGIRKPPKIQTNLSSLGAALKDGIQKIKYPMGTINWTILSYYS
jgi:hypothetical protein